MTVKRAPVLPTEHESKLARESSRLLAACISRGDSARLKGIRGQTTDRS